MRRARRRVALDDCRQAVMMALQQLQYAECLSIASSLRSFGEFSGSLLVFVAGLRGVRLPGFGGRVARMSVSQSQRRRFHCGDTSCEMEMFVGGARAKPGLRCTVEPRPRVT